MIVKTKCGTPVIIDDDYAQTFNMHSWRLDRYGYVRRTTTIYRSGIRKSGTTILLHRQIIGEIPEGMQIDHINRNKLDNRRANLRVVTMLENMRNRTNWNRGGIRGKRVARAIRKYKSKWYANMVIQGKSTSIGTFTNRSDAVAACVAERARIIEREKAR